MNAGDLQEFNRAMELANSGRHDEANALLARLRRMYPDDPNVLVWSAYTTPDLTAARAAIAEAQRFNPNDPAVLQARQWLQNQEQQAYRSSPATGNPPSFGNSAAPYNAGPSYSPTQPAPSAYNNSPPGFAPPYNGVMGNQGPTVPVGVYDPRSMYNRVSAPTRRKRFGSFGGLIFGLLFAGIFLAVAYYFFQDTQDYLIHGVQTTATVVKVRQSGGSKSTYYPTFQFQPASGPSVQVESNSGSNPPAYKVGDKVSIYYKPNKPTSIKVNDFVGLWLFAAIPGGLGLLVLLLVLKGFFFPSQRRQRRRRGNSSDGGYYGGSDYYGDDSGGEGGSTDSWDSDGSTGGWDSGGDGGGDSGGDGGGD